MLSIEGVEPHSHFNDIEKRQHQNELYILLNRALAGAGLLMAAIISLIICRRYKIHWVLVLGVVALSFLAYAFLTTLSRKTISLILPGGYLWKQIGITGSGMVNLIFLLLIAWLLFFSKHSRNWWLK
jgi:hypothetical protein